MERCWSEDSVCFLILHCLGHTFLRRSVHLTSVPVFTSRSLFTLQATDLELNLAKVASINHHGESFPDSVGLELLKMVIINTLCTPVVHVADTLMMMLTYYTLIVCKFKVDNNKVIR